MPVSLRHQSPPQYMLRLLLLFSMSIICFSILFSWQAWMDERAARIKELTTITELGEKSLDQYFLQLEAGMQYLVADWAREKDKLDLQHAYQDTKLFASLRPEITNITMISSSGEVIFSSKQAPGTLKVSIANDPTFIEYSQHAKEGPALKIGRAKLGITTNTWIVPIRYRVKDRAGEVQFILSALLPVEFLQNFWRNAPITERASLGLMRDDGYLISRYPTPKNKIPEEIFGKPRTGTMIKYLQDNAFPQSGTLEGVSSLVGAGIFNVYRRLSHYPITFFVITSNDELYLSWWERVKVTYFLTALLLGAAMFTYWISILRHRQWQREQENLDRVKAEFISVVSHELRTPITSIRGSLGLLEGGAAGALSPNALKLVQLAHRNSQRLSNLVNDILDMEKLMLGKITLNLQQHDLSVLVQNALEVNTGYAQALNVKLVLQALHSKKLLVDADGERLSQVLANLLSNAAKFSPAEQSVLVRIIEQDEFYVVEVEDKGKGIPTEFQQHIFNPFSQADSSDSRVQGGTGLGLHISKTLIERMGGQIGFRSTEGQGSTFWFALRKLPQ